MSEKVIREAIDAFNKGDSAALGKLFGGDLGKGVGQAVKATREAFPDLKYEIEHIVAHGDEVHFTYVAKGTNKGMFYGQKGTNKTAAWRGSGVANVQNGKISGLLVNEDAIARAIQLGHRLFAAQPSLTGNWQGSSQGIAVSLQLVQTGTSVSGNAQAFGSSFPVTGSVNYPNVSLAGNMNGVQVTFGGAYNPPPNTITGTLTALGSSLAVTITRQ